MSRMRRSWAPWALAGLAGLSVLWPVPSAMAQAAAPELIFSSPRTGSMQLYAIGSDASSVQQLTRGAGDSDSAVWSPDGQRIAFVSTRTGSPQVFVMRAEGSEQKRISGASDSNRNAAWSADGSSVAFSSSRDGSHGIYRYDFQTQTETRLSTHDDGAADLVWSPDGAWIAFTATSGTRETSIFLLDIKSGKTSPIPRVATGSDLNPQWSPDGRKLLYVKSAGRAGVNLYLAHADGSQARALTQGFGSSYSAVWAPDSRRIAFASNMHSGERMDIFMLDTTAGEAVNLSAHPHEDYEPAWAPDGRSVYFVSFRSGVSQLYQATLDGRVERVSRSTQYEGRPLPRPVGPMPATAAQTEQRPAGGQSQAQTQAQTGPTDWRPTDRSIQAAVAKPTGKE